MHVLVADIDAERAAGIVARVQASAGLAEVVLLDVTDPAGWLPWSRRRDRSMRGRRRPQERMMAPAIVAGLVRTAVTLPPEAVLQSAVLTLRDETYPR